MDWRIMLHLKNKKRTFKKIDVEKIKFYGKTKQEVRKLLGQYQYEYKNGQLCFILNEVWYGKRRTISLIFEKDKVEEKYIKTEYGKLSITKLYKNLS
ncbi:MULTISPECIES: hypothetical protein [Chryseobacterium]|uniref:hypothetical protein n=1 Tax=Chryseobacterium TaxID=59732 RepID=UPI0013C4BA6E|nr:hypothetical protein [Chryseobacterium aurantiacum]